MDGRRASRFRDWALLILCNLIWASQFVLAKLVQEQMGPIFATLLPMALATLLLIPLVRRERLRRGRRQAIGLRNAASFAVIGVFGQVVAQLGITWGVRFAPASNAALLSLTLPIATAVMAYVLLGERMTGSPLAELRTCGRRRTAMLRASIGTTCDSQAVVWLRETC